MATKPTIHLVHPGTLTALCGRQNPSQFGWNDNQGYTEFANLFADPDWRQCSKCRRAASMAIRAGQLVINQYQRYVAA